MLYMVFCGGRDNELTSKMRHELHSVVRRYWPIQPVLGGARGTDEELMWIFFDWYDIQPLVLTPDYEQFPPYYAPIERNQRMADLVGPDGVCVAFPGNRGTADMTRRALAKGMVVYQWNEGQQALVRIDAREGEEGRG